MTRPGREWMGSMSDWAGSSSGSSRLFRRLGTALLAAVVLLAAPPPAESKVYLTQEEALRSAFPPPTQVERQTLYLSEAEALKIAKEAGSPLGGSVFSYYVGKRGSEIAGYAWFDTHIVRTLPETIMVLLRPDGRIQRIDILSFAEPEDYFPKEPWRAQFSGKDLDADLALRRGIRGLTGASLTAEAITAACRRVLALHRFAGSKR